jgi:DNA/RNA-binding domain of Phe-tRNA-synthetase-like protein
MEQEIGSWVYLQLIVGNFDNMVKYYFQSMSFMAPWFRQAGVGVLYSMGLAWAGFCFLIAPIDRLIAGAKVLGMVVLSGFLLSPTNDTKNLGTSDGTELSVGAYYSFVIASSIISIFNDVASRGMDAQLRQAAGQGGPGVDQVAISFNDKSKTFADKFIQTTGKEAYIDYNAKCGVEAMRQARTKEDRAAMKAVGLNSATLGMSDLNSTTVMQFQVAQRNGDVSLADRGLESLRNGAGILNSVIVPTRLTSELSELRANRALGIEYLKNRLPDANSKIDGKKGYQIPTAGFYTATLGGNETITTANNYESIQGLGANFKNMVPNGALVTAPNLDAAYMFYPKDCADLYFVANQTMANLRIGVAGMPEFRDLEYSGAYQSASAAVAVAKNLTGAVNDKMKAIGFEFDGDSEGFESIGDSTFSMLTTIMEYYNAWMLKYKIPAMIASMAMIVALLLLCFPIFAILSILFGPKVFVTYAKFMAFPFVVSFINNLLLSLSVGIISYSRLYNNALNTTSPGGTDLAHSISGMATETIIYTTITVIEIAIAKFVLWDDVRSVSSFNPGSSGVNSAAQGAAVVAGALSAGKKAVAAGATGGGSALAGAASIGGSGIKSAWSTVATKGSNARRIGHEAENTIKDVGGGSSNGGGKPSGSGGNVFGSGNTHKSKPTDIQGDYTLIPNKK